MAAISSFFEVASSQTVNFNYIKWAKDIKWAESNKEQFGENQISISFFITEMC